MNYAGNNMSKNAHIMALASKMGVSFADCHAFLLAVYTLMHDRRLSFEAAVKLHASIMEEAKSKIQSGMWVVTR